jgi:hypothetical protein
MLAFNIAQGDKMNTPIVKTHSEDLKQQDLKQHEADSYQHSHVRALGKNLVSRDLATKLRPSECLFAVFVFVLWLVLFVGGITIDTRPSRCALSPDGVKALEVNLGNDGGTGAIVNRDQCNQAHSPTGFLIAAGVILLWFTPVNLALVSASAGALGTFGNLANISDEHKSRHTRENSNPYVSAMLRGFFVYLLMISGLLLLDLNPFSNPTPGQYIRLAGLMSILSFVVNYQPHLFGTLTALALRRLEERERAGAPPEANGSKVKYRRHETLDVKTEGTATVPPDLSSHEREA